MSNMTVFREEATKMKAEIASVLPAHLDIDRFQRVLTTSVNNNRKLLDANRASLWSAAMTAATFGLEVDASLRQCALVPFKGKVQFIPMVGGLVKLAMNGGWLLDSHCVRQADEFDFEYGSEAFIKHRPRLNAGRGGENPIIAAYATANPVLADMTGLVFEVLDSEKIIMARNASAGYQYDKTGSTWATHFEEMARKTPIRYLSKYLPLDVQKLVSLDARHERTGEVVTAMRDVTDDSIELDGGE